MCCSEREPGVCFWHSKLSQRGLGLQRECEMRVSSVGLSRGEQSRPAVCFPWDQRSQLPTTHAPETLASCNIYPLHEPARQRTVTQQPWKTAFNRTINPNQPFQHMGMWQSSLYYRFTRDVFASLRKWKQLVDSKSLTYEYMLIWYSREGVRFGVLRNFYAVSLKAG